MILNEIWKEIDFGNGYYISNMGRIKSTKNGKCIIMKQSNDGNGYMKVHLSDNGKEWSPKVHRLVAEYFIPNPNGYKEVNHINEQKNCNTVFNLEWCTREYNNTYGTMQIRSAEARVNGKRSKPIIGVNIKTGEVVEFPSTAEAGRNGFHQGHIVSCCNGETKTHKGYTWSYK